MPLSPQAQAQVQPVAIAQPEVEDDDADLAALHLREKIARAAQPAHRHALALNPCATLEPMATSSSTSRIMAMSPAPEAAS
jgi:hypothetical protein